MKYAKRMFAIVVTPPVGSKAVANAPVQFGGNPS